MLVLFLFNFFYIKKAFINGRVVRHSGFDGNLLKKTRIEKKAEIS
jgi:hypothetical protein